MAKGEYDVLIVGGGHAGAQCAIALRQAGFAGTVAIVGEEQAAPYERPPLSKDYLAGTKDVDHLAIRPPAFWSDKSIDLIGGEKIVAIDPAAKIARSESGQAWTYGKLVWAGGGHARCLDCRGHHLAGLHSIRTQADVDALRSELGPSSRIVVIGGGYIGLEAAAVLVSQGHSVTLLEAAPRVLARVAGPALGDFYEAEHRAHGVDLHTGVAVTDMVGDDRVTGVRLADGSIVPADIVIVGIGIVATSLPIDGVAAVGVEVDDYCRSTVPDIYAIGDCAIHASRFAGGKAMRIESVQNANDMANTVARHIAGIDAPYRATPWFWSNQYDLKLQTVGLSVDHDATVVRGNPSERSFSVIYLRDGAVIALDCVNRVKDYVQGRALVEAGATIDPTLLSDADVPLKSMMQEA